MTVTSETHFTVTCDDGRYCEPASIRLMVSTKAQACRLAKDMGWMIRHYSAARCPACKRRQRIPEGYPAGYPELGG
jgi:hypothetical protein